MQKDQVYTHKDKQGILWRFEKGRPISEIADKVSFLVSNPKKKDLKALPKGKVKNITRMMILEKIFHCFISLEQSIPHYLESALSNKIQAEQLIELLESIDCGSIGGGFDPGNPLVEKCRLKIYDRFLTLIKKENTFDDIPEYCGHCVLSLCKLFNKFCGLIN